MSGWYGSLENRLMERSATPKMEIGMGVTECLWSDCHAYEIIAIKDDRHITVRRLNASLKPGIVWPDQDYDYESDPNGAVYNLFKSKHGWRVRIGKNGLGNTKFAVGYAREYYDPSF